MLYFIEILNLLRYCHNFRSENGYSFKDFKVGTHVHHLEIHMSQKHVVKNLLYIVFFLSIQSPSIQLTEK